MTAEQYPVDIQPGLEPMPELTLIEGGRRVEAPDGRLERQHQALSIIYGERQSFYVEALDEDGAINLLNQAARLYMRSPDTVDKAGAWRDLEMFKDRLDGKSVADIATSRHCRVESVGQAVAMVYGGMRQAVIARVQKRMSIATPRSVFEAKLADAVQKKAEVEVKDVRDWHVLALCREFNSVIFEKKTERDAQLAKVICRQCTVRDECLAEALKPGAVIDHDVWGGLTPRERRKLIRNQAAGLQRKAHTL